MRNPVPVEPRHYKIDLEPIGRRIEVERGTNLLEAAQRAGIDLVASCGGIGICGTCRVRIIAGETTPVTLTEEESLDAVQRAAGFRLACQVEPLSDVRVDIPPDSLTVAQQMQVDGHEGAVAIDPVVIALDLVLSPPNLDDLRSDISRVDEELARAGYGPLQASLEMFGSLSLTLRRSGWKARLAIRSEGGKSQLVSILPPGAALVGLAMDLGSTKLALYLVDLASGVTLARAGVMNPQIAYGEDVVSRIAFANRSAENRKLLQTRLVESINETIASFCGELSITVDQIVDVVAVGNTAIHHLFSGLPVEQLGAAPYVPVVSAPLSFGAGELGLAVAHGARVYMPANIAGYVGADHVAALLATRSYASQRTALLVDIGTNTEVSLTCRGKVYSCSCASGPAFEGAHIKDGMRAASGAIDRVHIRSGEVSLTTINNALPVGICGSGILNAVAEMLNAGIIDERGVLRGKDQYADRMRTNGRQSDFLLAFPESTGHGREIVVTRKDVNEIQLAKGAIRAGIDILLKEAGITPEEVDEFIIAGAFGTFLDLESALRVGMFPELPRDRYHQVGNAAGVGAKEMLVSMLHRQEAAQIVGRVQYIELTTHPGFTPTFVEAMYFGRGGGENDTVVN